MMKPLCIFGILDTQKGNAIAKEMLQWLSPVYDITEVRHDGKQFEYPALKTAQELSVSTNRPVLYIHTRGAVNEWRTTIPTRRCWAEEFGNQWRKYFALADSDRPRVLCPFVDSDRETRYNGFVANTAAWKAIDLRPSHNRMIYEQMFCSHPEVEVFGLLITRDKLAIKEIRNYLYRNYEN